MTSLLAKNYKDPTKSICYVLGSIGCAFLFSSCLTKYFGSLESAFRVVSGTPLNVAPESFYECDKYKEFTSLRCKACFVVVNHSNSPVNIVGSEASCSCISVFGLPANVPALGQIILVVGVDKDQIESMSRLPIVLYTDIASQPRVLATLSAAYDDLRKVDTASEGR